MFLSVILFLTISAIHVLALPEPIPRDTPNPVIGPTTFSPFDLGPNINLGNFVRTELDAEESPFSIEIRNLFIITFSNASLTQDVPVQNYFAALVFVEHYLKGEYERQPASRQTFKIRNATTDVQTAGIWLHWDNPTLDLSYDLAADLITYMSYFMLGFSRQIFNFEIVQAVDPKLVLSGWFRSIPEDSPR